MVSIIGVPEYINYQYYPNILSLYTLITIIYGIPPLIITSWMTKYWLKNWKTMTKTGLRSDIFGLFLIMQIANELVTVVVIFNNRIPLTGIFTSYCASVNPQKLIDISQLVLVSSIHFKNLTTVLFCVVRVVMMYSSRIEKKMYFKELSVILLALFITSIILSWIRNEESSTCVQLHSPYPFGAIKIALVHPIDDKAIYGVIELFIYPIIIVILLISTGLTFWKLHQLKLHSRSVSLCRKKTDWKSEKTLTGAMILILLPIVTMEIVVICDSIGDDISILGSLQTLFGDARAHIVTCYFYFTHPIFKKKKTSLNKIEAIS